MHLNRTGKPETIQSSVGIFFTDEPPTNTCYTFKLGSYALDFPAGATNEIVRDSLVLPVDVDVLAAYPHAHFSAGKCRAIRPARWSEGMVDVDQAMGFQLAGRLPLHQARPPPERHDSPSAIFL
jgi:hypothetical protein